MNRKFLIGVIFLVILNLLVKPFWFFGIEVTVQNRLANAQYGLYFSLFSFSIIFSFLLDAGITNFNNREIARHNQLIAKYLSNIIGIKFILGIVYLVVCLIIGFISGYNKEAFGLLIIIMINQFLLSLILYLRSNISGLLMFITDSFISVMDRVLMIAILSMLLWTNIFGGRFSVEYFVYAQTLAYLLTAVTALIIVIKKSAYFKPRINFKFIVVIVKKSLPFSLLVLLMALYNRLEPVFLERLLPDGKVQAGMYAQGFRILEVLSNFSYLFPALLLPLFSKMLRNKESISHLLSLAGSLMIVPSVIAACACSLYSKEIIKLFYHQPSEGNIFGTLILGYIGITITYLYGTLLTANGNFRQLNIMASLAVLLNISLNLALIPLFKANGAAWASFITQTTTASAQLILAHKILHLKSERKLLIRLIYWLVTYAIALIAIKYFIPGWKTGFIIMLCSGFVSAILFRLLNLKEMVKTIFSERYSVNTL
jgi:O-antigen/teichoic acid export membrane protein